MHIVVQTFASAQRPHTSRDNKINSFQCHERQIVCNIFVNICLAPAHAPELCFHFLHSKLFVAFERPIDLVICSIRRLLAVSIELRPQIDVADQMRTSLNWHNLPVYVIVMQKQIGEKKNNVRINQAPKWKWKWKWNLIAMNSMKPTSVARDTHFSISHLSQQFVDRDKFLQINSLKGIARFKNQIHRCLKAPTQRIRAFQRFESRNFTESFGISITTSS